MIPTEWTGLGQQLGAVCSFVSICSCYGQDIKIRAQSPVVQSVVSLTSSLRAISLTILADSIYNFLKFFAEKM